MSIKNKNAEIKVVKGCIPIASVMIGTDCVYGKDEAEHIISYEPVQTGSGFYISVNGRNMVVDPVSAGTIAVRDNSDIVVRTYGLAGYENPDAVVMNKNSAVEGTLYTVNVDNLIIPRATIYSYKAKSDGHISVSPAPAAKKVSILINKDSGIDTLSINYLKGPFDYSGSSNITLSAFSERNELKTSVPQVFVGSRITTGLHVVIAKEGYKVVTITSNCNTALSYDNECTITASSKAGRRVTITCPAKPTGVASYQLYLTSSAYSRNVSRNVFFTQETSETNVLSQRTYGNNSYYFYEEDVIRIEAVRVLGYKRPTLGMEGDVTSFVVSKTIKLAEDTVLIVQGGEKGFEVTLSNVALSSGEYVSMNVISEYSDGYQGSRNPRIFVGDTIRIPNEPYYRIGTRQNRKPGVGFNNGETVLVPVTFTSTATINVPDIPVLTVKLMQGAPREYVTTRELGRLFQFEKEQSESMKINGSYVPVDDYGAEKYYLEGLRIQYYCKRYLADVVMKNYVYCEQLNPSRNFSFDYVDIHGHRYNGVLVGNFQTDGETITFTITRYNDNWVADISQKVEVYPHTIFV